MVINHLLTGMILQVYYYVIEMMTWKVEMKGKKIRIICPKIKYRSPSPQPNYWLVVSTHLKNMLVKMEIFP